MAKHTGQGFPHTHRVVRGADYRAIYNEGNRIQGDRFVLFWRENSLDHHRLGITVSRKVGNAVVRNRIKRLFREVFRRSCAEIPHHYDFIVNARRGCDRAGYMKLREDFLALTLRKCR